MIPKDRFYATIRGEKVDRPASWLGLPVPSAIPGLLKHFRCSTLEEVKLQLEDDVWPVDVPYNYPPFNHVACAFDFAKRDASGKVDERTLTAPGFFEGMTDPADVDKFDWPDPAKYFDAEEARRRAKAIPDKYFRLGILWSAHFQDALSAFGMENALITMMMYPDMFTAVIDRITDFYLKVNGMFYEATKGYLDGILIGNDFGSQKALMVDPDSIRKYVFPGTKKLIDQAKSYGLVVIHHSCGSVFPIIGDIFELGAEVVHPIQALAADMDAETLSKNFREKGAFCGGVDAQNLLVNGTPEEVEKEVKRLLEIFPTRLVFSPSHEAILPDIPPANVEALFRTVKSAAS